MNSKKYLVGLPILFSLLMSGCSAGDTPELPETTAPSDSAGMNTPDAIPTNPPKDGESPSAPSTAAPTASPKSTERPVDPNEPDRVERKPPYNWSTVPATATPPVYDNVETRPVEKPAETDAAFSAYLSFHDALKEENWSKACDHVALGKGKTKDFCVDWYEVHKASTPIYPKLENFNIVQELNSGDILMTNKDTEDHSQRHFRMKRVGDAWKVSIDPITSNN